MLSDYNGMQMIEIQWTENDKLGESQRTPSSSLKSETNFERYQLCVSVTDPFLPFYPAYPSPH
jgi:hypothetical protein